MDGRAGEGSTVSPEAADPRFRLGEGVIGELLRRVGVFAVADLFTKGPEFFLLPLYLAFLPPAEYGIVAVATVITGVLRPTLNFGIQAAAQRYYFVCKSEEERRSFYAGLWSVSVVGGLSIYLLLDVVWSTAAPTVLRQVEYTPFIRMAVWTAFISAAFIDLPREILRASGRPAAYGLLNLAVLLVTAGAIVWFMIVQGQGAFGAVLGNLVGTAMVAGATAVALARYARLPIPVERVKAAVFFGLPLVPHFAAHWILSASDRLILERFVPLAEVGVYTAGYIIGWSVSVIKLAITNAMIPLYGTLNVKVSSEQEHLAELTTYYVAVLAVAALAVTAFRHEILSVVGSGGYDSAGAVVPWVALGAFCLALYNPSVQVLNLVAGRSKVIGVGTIAAAGLNILLNLLLIPMVGIVGAAISTAVSYLLLAALMFVAAQRAVRLPYEYGRLGVVLASVVTAAIVAITQYGEITSLTGLAAKSTLVVVTGAIVWATSCLRRESRTSPPVEVSL